MYSKFLLLPYSSGGCHPQHEATFGRAPPWKGWRGVPDDIPSDASDANRAQSGVVATSYGLPSYMIAARFGIDRAIRAMRTGSNARSRSLSDYRSRSAGDTHIISLIRTGQWGAIAT